jgi:hypothetical protein
MDPRSTPSDSRRPWWATFSVRAHRELRALAADILLYDRLILPRPADADEYDRFVRAGWDPELQEAVERQAADSVYSVMWSPSLREEWAGQWRRMTAAGKPADAAFGATPLVMAQTEQGWEEIMAALAPDTPPEQRPILMPAFQSAKEAQAELALKKPANAGGVGQAPADKALIVEMSRLVEEPALHDSEEAFLAAAELATKPSFEKARSNLLSYVDRLARDEVSFDDARRNLRELEDEYNSAVRDFRVHTWKRRAAILIPVLGGAGIAAAGGTVLAPLVAKGLGTGTSWTLKRLTGRLVPDRPDPDQVHPGRAIALVRAAYRNAQPEPSARR